MNRKLVNVLFSGAWYILSRTATSRAPWKVGTYIIGRTSPKVLTRFTSSRRCFSNCPVARLTSSDGNGLGTDVGSRRGTTMQRLARWHLLNFFPLPHGHGSLRPTFINLHSNKWRTKSEARECVGSLRVITSAGSQSIHSRTESEELFVSWRYEILTSQTDRKYAGIAVFGVSAPRGTASRD